jgi:hypothetical protein
MSNEIYQWKYPISVISDGDKVDQTNTNKPLRDIENNLLYLKSKIDGAAAGKAIISAHHTVNAETKPGTPVYLDSTCVWQPAQALLESEVQSDGSSWKFADKARVMGVVYTKPEVSSTSGDVIVYGEATFTGQILDVIDGQFINGSYYLSSTSEGKLIKDANLLIKVCDIVKKTDSEYVVFVSPDTKRNRLDSHIHYHVELNAVPAGTPSEVPYEEGYEWGFMEPGGPYPDISHRVVDSDTSIEGWLPADHTIFTNLNVPEGAKFGYNLSENSTLSEQWPPLPVRLISSACIEVDGVSQDSDTVILNEDGIWWMDDSYGNAPWPLSLCESSSSSSSSLVYNEANDTKKIDLWFTKITFESSIASVRSLSNNDNSIILAKNTYGDYEIQTVEKVVPSLQPDWVSSSIENSVLDPAAAYASSSSSSTTPSAPFYQNNVAYPYYKLGTDAHDPAIVYKFLIHNLNLPDGVMLRMGLNIKVFPIGNTSSIDLVDAANKISMYGYILPARASLGGDKGSLILTPPITIGYFTWDNPGDVELEEYTFGTLYSNRVNIDPLSGQVVYLKLGLEASGVEWGLLDADLIIETLQITSG